jgi:hypothetical protein
LEAGETMNDTFTVTSEDGTTETVTVIITGVDYTPTAGGENSVVQNYSGQNSSGGDLLNSGLDGLGLITLSLSEGTVLYSGGNLVTLQSEVNGLSTWGYLDGLNVVTVFTVDVFEDDAGNGGYDYSLSIHETIDYVTSTNFDQEALDVSGGNNNQIYLYADGTVSSTLFADRVLLTTVTSTDSSNAQSTINSNTHGMGVGGGVVMDVGETLEFDYGSGIQSTSFGFGFGANGDSGGQTTIDYLVSVVDANNVISSYTVTEILEGAAKAGSVFGAEITAPANSTIVAIDVTVTEGDGIIFTSIGSNYVTTGVDVPISFDYTVVDADGDADAGSFTVTATPVIEISGTSDIAPETVTGTIGDDALIGGAGNDTLIGGAGDDIFVWNLSEDAAEVGASSPASDLITDFGNGNDSLLLNDLLDPANYSDSASLSIALAGFMEITDDGAGNTLISVSSAGIGSGPVDQVITLDNVSLAELGASGTQQEMIQDLLDAGKLNVDI